MRSLTFVALVVMSVLYGQSVHATTVELQALLGSMAVLSIDGQRKNLRPGQSHGSVTLVSTTSSSALLEIDGRRKTVAMSQRVGTSYQGPSEMVVTIPRNQHNQYITTASINGRRVQVMVDTGANVVAMSANQAKLLGIDATQGATGRVQTASGVVGARQVKLLSVNVGGINVQNVNASVINGEYPVTVLLGMSYLRHVKIEENKGIMSLSRVE